MQTKEQAASYMKRKYDAQRRFFLELLGGRCRHCGSTTLLEFDHIDPTSKTIEVGMLFGKPSIVAAVIELITKCQILCRDCHRKKSAREFKARPVTFRHGTMYGWMHKKCPCDVCEKAKREWNSRRNEKRRKESGAPRGQYAPRVPMVHGTKNKYSQGCRCEGCREAHRVAMAEYRKQKLPA